MNNRVTRYAIAFLMAAGFAVPSLAADDAAVKKDLFTVITLQGLPCGEVVAIVCCEPDVQLNVWVEVYGVPSTEKERPTGFVCTVT